MLLRHCVRRAASRADCTAGNKSPIRIAMIAIVTISSISVNPERTLGLTEERSLGHGMRLRGILFPLRLEGEFRRGNMVRVLPPPNVVADPFIIKLDSTVG